MNNTTVTDFEIDTYDRMVTLTASWDDDKAFETLLTFDPAGTIYNAWVARNHQREDARRAALTDTERAAEDAQNERLLARGMEIVREIMARHRPG